DNLFGKAIFNGWRMGHLFTYVSGQRAWATLGSIQQASNTSNVASLSTLFLGTPDLGPRMALTGDVNALSQDISHYFDPTKLAVQGIYPAADGTGPRNYIVRPGNFANDMTITKAFKIHENHAFELRAAFYNAFNQVRRTTINTSAQFKANGRTAAD